MKAGRKQADAGCLQSDAMSEANEKAEPKRGGLPAVMKGMHATREALAETEKRVTKLEEKTDEIEKYVYIVAKSYCAVTNEFLPQMIDIQKMTASNISEIRKKLEKLREI